MANSRAGKFQGQVVLITGASSGIGEAVAREFAREGAHTVLMARRAERIEALAEELSGAGLRSLAVTGDVTRDGDLERAVDLARSEFGRLDVAVANAGFSVGGRFVDLTLEDYRRQLETNVFGVLRTLFAALPELRKTQGRIVVVGSLLGIVPVPLATPYCMSKFALVPLCDGLSHELAPLGVSVTHILPGFVASEIYQVDNRGVRLDAPPPQRTPPAWLLVSPAQTARQIVSAAYRRKRTRFVGLHSSIGSALQRHFPGLLHFAISRAIRRAALRGGNTGAMAQG
jgi:NAD(P)-dependent dehydrogenase (short-subunit alcohol dehydrogenase family)